MNPILYVEDSDTNTRILTCRHRGVGEFECC